MEYVPLISDSHAHCGLPIFSWTLFCPWSCSICAYKASTYTRFPFIFQTLADNLKSFMSYSKDKIDDAILESKEFRERLMKATGMEDKTLGDRVADVLEAVHLKSPSKAKVAANKLASAIPDLSEMKESFQDIDVTAWPKELKEQYDNALSGLKMPDNVWDRTLKKLGLKEKSIIEKAAAE